MNSLEILNVLEAYRLQISQVLGLQPDTDIIVSIAYSFISIQTPDTHIQFEINDSSAKLYELYPASDNIKSKIESVTWPGLNSKITTSIFSDEVKKHLATSDSIAALAVNCVRGDDYRPGSFSKTIYSNSQIELQQINHMNSRSLDHKKDYSLRSLTFKIDLKNTRELKIDFTDHSSENNKHCSDKIKVAIANLASPSSRE